MSPILSSSERVSWIGRSFNLQSVVQHAVGSGFFEPLNGRKVVVSKLCIANVYGGPGGFKDLAPCLNGSNMTMARGFHFEDAPRPSNEEPHKVDATP